MLTFCCRSSVATVYGKMVRDSQVPHDMGGRPQVHNCHLQPQPEWHRQCRQPGFAQIVSQPLPTFTHVRGRASAQTTPSLNSKNLLNFWKKI